MVLASAPRASVAARGGNAGTGRLVGERKYLTVGGGRLSCAAPPQAEDNAPQPAAARGRSTSARRVAAPTSTSTSARLTSRSPEQPALQPVQQPERRFLRAGAGRMSVGAPAARAAAAAAATAATTTTVSGRRSLSASASMVDRRVPSARASVGAGRLASQSQANASTATASGLSRTNSGGSVAGPRATMGVRRASLSVGAAARRVPLTHIGGAAPIEQLSIPRDRSGSGSGRAAVADWESRSPQSDVAIYCDQPGTSQNGRDAAPRRPPALAPPQRSTSTGPNAERSRSGGRSAVTDMAHARPSMGARRTALAGARRQAWGAGPARSTSNTNSATSRSSRSAAHAPATAGYDTMNMTSVSVVSDVAYHNPDATMAMMDADLLAGDDTLFVEEVPLMPMMVVPADAAAVAADVGGGSVSCAPAPAAATPTKVREAKATPPSAGRPPISPAKRAPSPSPSSATPPRVVSSAAVRPPSTPPPAAPPQASALAHLARAHSPCAHSPAAPPMPADEAPVPIAQAPAAAVNTSPVSKLQERRNKRKLGVLNSSQGAEELKARFDGLLLQRAQKRQRMLDSEDTPMWQ